VSVQSLSPVFFLGQTLLQATISAFSFLIVFLRPTPPVKAKDAICNPVVMSARLSVIRMRGQEPIGRAG